MTDLLLKDDYLPRIRAALDRWDLARSGSPCRAFALAWRKLA